MPRLLLLHSLLAAAVGSALHDPLAVLGRAGPGCLAEAGTRWDRPRAWSAALSTQLSVECTVVRQMDLQVSRPARLVSASDMRPPPPTAPHITLSQPSVSRLPVMSDG